jgi:hypothetical protein
VQVIVQFFQGLAADGVLHFAGVNVGRFGVYADISVKKRLKMAWRFLTSSPRGGFGGEFHAAVGSGGGRSRPRPALLCARYARRFDAQHIADVAHARGAFVVGAKGNGFR